MKKKKFNDLILSYVEESLQDVSFEDILIGLFKEGLDIEEVKYYWKIFKGEIKDED
jgi:hypothetical protein